MTLKKKAAKKKAPKKSVKKKIKAHEEFVKAIPESERENNPKAKFDSLLSKLFPPVKPRAKK